MKNNYISVNSDKIEEMIVSVNEVSEALWKTAYTGNEKYILGEDPESQGRRAIDFVKDYADLTGAVLRMIATTTEIIAEGIANDEIQITVKQNTLD